jgi:hypothetical protein
MHYQIVIETHEGDSGLFRADVVKGPKGATGTYMGIGSSPREAYKDAIDLLERTFKQHTFDFLHVEL